MNESELNEYSLCDVLPQRPALHIDGKMMARNDISLPLQQMCRCLASRQHLERRDGAQGVLFSWYVPRNEQDAEVYVRRYKVMSLLHGCIKSLLERKNERV